MIFLSHTHHDKPVVEPVALRLRDMFGQDEVFYDSWSIRPGDGIIDRMNAGLSSPEFVFFFVSSASLKSGMVKLEWQNALLAATRGKTRLVPVRVDGCEMPPIMLQNLYIDMYTMGIEATIYQIVKLIQGDTAFQGAHKNFSNLTYTYAGNPKKKIRLVITASHLFEPDPHFIIAVNNAAEDFGVTLESGGVLLSSFGGGLKLDVGETISAFRFRTERCVLAPNKPIILSIVPDQGKSVEFRGLMHDKGNSRFEFLPQTEMILGDI